jgi:hypothetical protein
MERRTAVAAASAEVLPPPMATVPAPAVPAEVVPEAKRPAAVGSDRKSAASLARMVALLDRELALTGHQREAAERFLQERNQEIKACHAAIVRAGVIDIPNYEWQVREMKDGWYRKLDALLDRAQHDRFLALVQQGFFNEGLSFTVEPGMTVLD